MSAPVLSRALALAAATLTLAACDSPEAERVRGGDLGADVGNRDAIIEMHGGSVIYYNVPCNTTLPDCDGPIPRRTALRQAIDD